MRTPTRLASLMLSAAMTLAASGCFSLTSLEACEFGIPKPPPEQSKGGVVVLFQAAEDFPNAQTAIAQSDQLRTFLPETTDDTPFSLAIATADGSPNLLFQSWINIEFGEGGLDLEQKRKRAQATLGNVYGCAFTPDSQFGTLDDNVDIIGGLRVASGALAGVEGKKLILVLSNGFQTAGQPDFSDNFPADFDEVDAIITVLKQERALPDLSGVEVQWIGLGQVVSGREQLDQQAFNTLEYFWKQLIQASEGKAPESFLAGALGNSAIDGAPSTTNLADIRGLCLFSLDETSGFAFQPNSDSFVNESLAREGAESIARQILEADCGNRSLKVTGFTASGKSKTQFEVDGPNLGLSKARAQAFADLLIELGLNVELVVGGGKGPTNDWDEDGQFVEELGKKNRIVLVEEIR